ncbi:50S ribosomal protein L21 [candidate division CSSED10-310 bacterium]|uniref:Large ribosomal subunit protein bL21 n=1 Tax=candidate division CSSED10-310 bacterium TaxID=2855610 RepID=A0ABV6YSI8_UNCC1
MFAVIESGGKQYRVEPDQVIQLEKLEGNIGDKIIFDQVLLMKDSHGIHVGQPVVKGALVESKIVDQMKAKKVVIFKKKRRKGYHKKQGHRQRMTSLKITDIHSPIS